jgi:lipoate-protein ligase A
MKKGQLSDQEREYICLRLAGYSQQTIACYFLKHEIISMKDLKDEWSKEIQQKNKILKSDMSKTVHKYVKKLMKVKEDSRFSWSAFIDFLAENGYQEISHRAKVSKMLVEYDPNLDNNKLILLLQQLIDQNSLNIKIIDIE